MKSKKINLEERMEQLDGILSSLGKKDDEISRVIKPEIVNKELLLAILGRSGEYAVEDIANAISIFHDSYHVHKEQHGSFRDIYEDRDYIKLMNERYLFCYEEAMKFLNRTTSKGGIK